MSKRAPNRTATRRPVNPLEAPFRQLAALAGDLQPNRLPGDSLRQLGDIRAVLATAIDANVDRCHEAGYSWTQIGAALGISPQAAQQGHARRHTNINAS